jgi:hypothetical protein
MVYKKNPFGSSAGNEIVKNIFDLMFISEDAQPSAIEKNNLQRQVRYYRGNIINIVNNMRKFVDGYQQVPVAESSSSGIHVCPHCRRRDFIYHWEAVDGGHYSDPNSWNKSVHPKEWKGGFVGEKGRFCFAIRYRCNKVTTCNKCHTTVIDSNHSVSSCSNCGDSGNLSKVGCLKESYGVHFIREYTMEDNCPTSMAQAMGVIERNRQVPAGGRRFVQGTLTGYELVIPSLPSEKTVVKTFQEIKRHTPYVKMTYTDRKTGTKKQTDYPISEMNYALSKQNQRRCRRGKMSGGAYAHDGRPKYLRDGSYDPLSECPSCGATDAPTVEDIPNIYYRPRPMRIMNPQPLGGEAVTPYSYKGLPVNNIYLESTVNREHKILLPLPVVKSLRPIPDEPSITERGISSNACPNDVGMGIQMQDAIDRANEQLQEAQANLNADLQAQFGLGPADEQTAKGFTFLVAEGRSRKAYLDLVKNKWIDESPDCFSYRGQDGSLLSSRRTYARWNKVPRYADPNSDSNEYLGPNPATHIIMDWIRASNNIAVFIDSPTPYHATTGIGEILDEFVGTRTEIIECLTCKGIVEKGDVLSYRVSKGQANADGTAKGFFPQAVLDAEIQYQNSFPLQNNKGDPVPIAWGVTTGGQDGKEMLRNPARRIRID